jgi:hypothetical protein
MATRRAAWCLALESGSISLRTAGQESRPLGAALFLTINFVERSESGALAGDRCEGVQEVTRRSRQAIKPRDHVAGAKLGERTAGAIWSSRRSPLRGTPGARRRP